MKWKLSTPELARLAELLTASVATGATGDKPLRDRCLDLLRVERNRGATQRLRLADRSAQAATQRVLQRTGHKGLT
jgi:hypothetical protein